MWAVQVAAFSALDAALSCPVYDEPPGDVAYPYVLIGEATAVPANVQGRTGREVTLTLHVWSDYAGMKEAQGIVDTIDAVMDDAALTVAGYELVHVWLDFSGTVGSGGQLSEDAKLRHIVARYRVQVFEA
jgi:hypothetical protein